MKTRLFNVWDRLAGSYWFIPSTFIVFALCAAALFPYIDKQEGVQGALPQWMLIGPDSVRALLSTIVGVMATVVSLVFSLTILTLSIGAQQFGPRLLRSFLNNRSTQIALGTFVATAIYALILLSLVRESEATAFVPCISVYVAIVASVFNLISLIHFVSAISELIQAPNVVAQVACDLDAAVERLYPLGNDDDGKTAESSCEELTGPPSTLVSRREGYLQGVDVEALVVVAAKAHGVIQFLNRPGQFIARGLPLAHWRGDQDAETNLESALNLCTVTGPRRTPRQDVECALLELVELAVRALSPGVNDPFTAINCIDRLGAVLGRIALRPVPPSQFFDEEGALRVVLPAIVMDDLIDAAFNQVRQHGRGDTAVLIRILEGLQEVARQGIRPSDSAGVLRHVDMVVREAESSVPEPNDRADIEARAAAIQATLKDTHDLG